MVESDVVGLHSRHSDGLPGVDDVFVSTDEFDGDICSDYYE